MSAFIKDIIINAVKSNVAIILEDHRNAKIAVSPEESEQLANLTQKAGFFDKFNAILIYSKKSVRFFKFYGNLCRKLNLNIRCIDSLEIALDCIDEIKT